VHDRLGDLEDGKGEDAVPDHHPEDVATLELGEEIPEGRFPPLRVDRGRSIGRPGPEHFLGGRERRQDRSAIARPPLGRSIEHPLDQLGEFGGARNVQLPGRRRLRGPSPLPLRERVLPGQHPVEHHPQREDIGPLVLRVVFPLLRGHVGRRSTAEPTSPEGVGHPEVEDLHLPLVRDEHVRGLEIPVDHSLRVGVGEPPGHLRRDVHRLLDRKRPYLDPAIERLPA
jgi:hypothetical protein